MKAAIRLIDGMSTGLGKIGAWVMLPLILSMVYEVVARHMFGAPTAWAYEVGYMLAGSCYMLGFAYCMRVRGHIRVDFLYDQMSPKGKARVDLIGYSVLLLPGALWLTWGLYGYAMEAFVDNEHSGESAWNPLIWPFRAVWVIGYIAICLQTIGEILKALLVLMDDNSYEEARSWI